MPPGGKVRLRLAGVPRVADQDLSVNADGFEQIPATEAPVTTGDITEFAVS
ncbi:hypothetical protein SGFS_051700 [Streptomyces graminofaciens]|uniref:Uncharacterized protein n=1 Tax=Streptomyces graminofaciens TaxID=68212 RepID=A0ABM7FCG9_9ACTN|nr:hypothetical protein SGFS_051700 [Streptomyces graminofaciens]